MYEYLHLFYISKKRQTVGWGKNLRRQNSNCPTYHHHGTTHIIMKLLTLKSRDISVRQFKTFIKAEPSYMDAQHFEK
jgi:hypothetical protein